MHDTTFYLRKILEKENVLHFINEYNSINSEFKKNNRRLMNCCNFMFFSGLLLFIFPSLEIFFLILFDYSVLHGHVFKTMFGGATLFIVSFLFYLKLEDKSTDIKTSFSFNTIKKINPFFNKKVSCLNHLKQNLISSFDNQFISQIIISINKTIPHLKHKEQDRLKYLKANLLTSFSKDEWDGVFQTLISIHEIIVHIEKITEASDKRNAILSLVTQEEKQQIRNQKTIEYNL